MVKLIEVLNLGAGVQSSTVLLMSLAGELPKLDHAIFADTGWEPAAVYRQVDWLEGLATAAGVQVHRVSAGNIKDDCLRVQENYTGPESDRQIQKGMTADGQTRWGSMPLKVLNPDGTGGIIRRQCTSEYKIAPIERCIRRDILGLKPRQQAPKEPTIRQWFGISFDERTRMKIAEHAWSEHCYPLVELRYTRLMCLDWLRSHGYPDAPRSACIGCPYHSNREWRDMKENRPSEWGDAVAFDEAIRHCGGMRGQVFIHSDLIPLRDVNLYKDQDPKQYRLPGFDDECAGMCGV